MRILSLAPSNTEILYALGAEEHIIANTRYCDHPEDAQKKPKVGGWLDVKYQLISEYHPDIIITSTFVQDKIIARFKMMGIEIMHLDPVTLDDVYESIIRIGKLVGKEGKAHIIVGEMKTELESIRQESLKLPRVKVYCEEWHKPATVSGNWVPALIEIAGGDPVLIKEGVHSREVKSEEVIAENPDVIIVSLCGIGIVANVDEIKNREGWNLIKAVENNKVFAINDSLLNRHGPRLVEGAKLLFELFHQKSE